MPVRSGRGWRTDVWQEVVGSANVDIAPPCWWFREVGAPYGRGRRIVIGAEISSARHSSRNVY